MQYTQEQLDEMAIYNPRRLAIIQANIASEKEEAQAESAEPRNPDQQEAKQDEASETQAPEPEAVATPESVEKPAETVQAEVKDLEYYKKKAAEGDSWKKRAGDAKAELTPVQQERAELEKKNAEMEAKLASMHKLLEEIKEKSAAQPEVVADEDEDFEDQFPSINNKLKAERAKFQARIDELEKKLSGELTPLKESTREAKERLEKENAAAQEARHFSELCAIHPDAGDFFSAEKTGPAFYAWGENLRPYQQKVMHDPTAYAPEDIADIISKFKQEVLHTKTKPSAPAIGDLASRVQNQAGNKAPTKVEDLMSDFEFANINRLMHAAAQQGQGVLQKLMERYERTAKIKYPD